MVRSTTVPIVLALLVHAVPGTAQQLPSREVLEIGAGGVAKITASAVFVAGRTVESVLAGEFSTDDRFGAMLQPLLKLEVDRERYRVTARLLDVERTAVYRPGLGCALVVDGVLPGEGFDDVPEEPADPDAVDWPIGDRNATEPGPDGVDSAALERALDQAFVGHAPPVDPRTRAVVVVYDGKIVAERYAEGFDADTRLHGWSMTKSVVNALIGIRIGAGVLDDLAPCGLSQWGDAADPRSFITIDQLLRMSSGLRFEESYSALDADPTRMLFAEPDAAAFAADRELVHPPGEHFSYSSGTTNILCRLLRESFEAGDAEYHRYPRRALFNPVGMRSALIETDPSGTFVGSSLMYATARDWARFGLLYLRDGKVGERRILPEGWVERSVTPTPNARRGDFGRHWWLNAGAVDDPTLRASPTLSRDLFQASGYEGQVVAVFPSRDAVIVRLGCTKSGASFRESRFLRSVLDALPQRAGYTIPLVDLADDESRQVVVDREAGQYLGHPTTLLLDDGATILCVFPEGHGRGPIVYKRSRDGGRTWSERLQTPASWALSKEVPTLFPIRDAAGAIERIVMFSGLYPIRMAHSEDLGETWSELEPIGDFGGIVAMSSCVRLRDGRYMALFHDDGRFLRVGGERADPPLFHVYKTISADGGLTWSPPVAIATHPQAHLCEPGATRSPDGEQIAVLLRENSRRRNSFVIFSDDEGETWSAPRELPGALTGDRHTARYVDGGELFVSFRDTACDSPTQGDWVGWFGIYDDLVCGGEGRCRVRLMDNRHRWDCAYPGVEVLPDGTIVTTTYGHWSEGEPPYIVSVRLHPREIAAGRR